MKELTIEEIAKIIDPDGTFLSECEKLVKLRFGNNYEEDLK